MINTTIESLRNIPKIVWSGKLWDNPTGSRGTHFPLEVDLKNSIHTKHGVPIGGIGTGSFL